MLSTVWIVGVMLAQAGPASPVVVAPLKVVVANPVVADLVRAVGANDVELIVLGAGGDPHHDEPTPADARRILEADLVLRFGLGLDRSLGLLHKSTGSQGRLVVVAEGLGKAGGHAHEHDHDADHTHDPAAEPVANESAVDPHIWHDPTSVLVLNERICAGLVAARPGIADAVRSRSLDLAARITDLDKWIQTQLSLVPESKRVLATTHDGLQYFGDRYGFRVVAVEMSGDQSVGADPPPSVLIEMVRALQATKCSVVFGDGSHPSRIAAAVAREAKVRLVETLRLDALLPSSGAAGASAYLETMRSNVTAIVEALKE